MAVCKYLTKSGESRYKATVWNNNRAVHSRSFRRKADADSWLAREQIKMEDIRAGRAKGEGMTLSSFFNEVYFPNHGVRESTATDYLRIFKNHLEPVFGNRKFLTIDEGEWASLLRNLIKTGKSAARTNRIRSVASRIYNFAIKWKYAQHNPLLLVPYQEEALSDFIYWSEDHTEKFLTWAHENAPERFPLYHFLYETGVRISEAIGLQWDCVSFDHGTIEIRRGFCRIMNRVESSTKGKKKRILGINQSLRETFLGLYNQRRSGFVFSKPDGQNISYEYYRNKFQLDQESAGVSKIGIHDIRHTFASHFVMRGGSIYDLKDLLGHADIKTTEIYAHLAPNHLIGKSSVVQFKLPKMASVTQLKAPNHFPTMDVDKAKPSLQEGLPKAT
jgi:site-specific recombinase XerD